MGEKNDTHDETGQTESVIVRSGKQRAKHGPPFQIGRKCIMRRVPLACATTFCNLLAFSPRKFRNAACLGPPNAARSTLHRPFVFRLKRRERCDSSPAVTRVGFCILVGPRVTSQESQPEVFG